MKKYYCILAFLLLSVPVIWSGPILVPDQYVYPGIPFDANKRLSSYPYLSGDTFRALCDWILDETHIPFDPTLVADGDVIFLNANWHKFFFNVVHPQIKARYILVTHNSVFHAPAGYAHYLDDPKLIAWFAKNAMIDHPKLFPLPLGLANRYWPHGDVERVSAMRKQLPDIERDKLLYVNFDTGTNPVRIKIFEKFANQPYSYTTGRRNFTEYLDDLARSKYVISPPGSSLDCHRIWESVLMNCIPIVETSPLDKMLYDMPVLIVQDWDEVTPELLEQKYDELMARVHASEKMYAAYWIRTIAFIKQQIKMGDLEGVYSVFGLDFHAAMSNSDRYVHETAFHETNWVAAKKAYDAYCAGYSYASEPRIPRIIHQIWLGSEFPEKNKFFQQSWQAVHPDWQYILWTDADVESFGLKNKAAFDASTNWGQKSDIFRYEILDRYGGVYVDTDFQAIRPLDLLHHSCDFYTGTGFGPKCIVYMGIIGSVPGHPVLKQCIDSISLDHQYNQNAAINILYTTGPYHFTRCFFDTLGTVPLGTCVAFPVNYFYPWPNSFAFTKDSEPINFEETQAWIRPETLAMHHWHASWNNGVPPGK